MLVSNFTQTDALVCGFCYRFVGSIELQIGRRILAFMQEEVDNSGSTPDDASPSSYVDQCFDHNDHNGRMPRGSIHLPDGFVESLISGRVCLPYSELFHLPPIVRCFGGCNEEVFCRHAPLFHTTVFGI